MYYYTHMSNLILCNELWKVEFSLVVCEEVLALWDSLTLQSNAHRFVVLTMPLNHCRTANKSAQYIAK